MNAVQMIKCALRLPVSMGIILACSLGLFLGPVPWACSLGLFLGPVPWACSLGPFRMCLKHRRKIFVRILVDYLITFMLEITRRQRLAPLKAGRYQNKSGDRKGRQPAPHRLDGQFPGACALFAH